MKHANTLLQQAADLLQTCDEITAVEIHRKQTERAKALSVLHDAQKWRRDGRVPARTCMPDPKQFGWAIDIAIRELRSHFRSMDAPVKTTGSF